MENHDTLERIDMMLGEKCNNNCIFCNVGDKKNIFYDKQKIFSILDDASKKGCKKVNLLGGEPTIHPDFIEIIKYAKLKKFEVIGVTTNARMFCYTAFVNEAILSGLNNFTIAVYSFDKQTYESITQSANSFVQSIKGIKNILKFKDSLMVSTNVVINLLNYKQLIEITKFILDLGITNIHFSINDLRGDNIKKYKSDLSLELQIKSLLELFKTVDQMNKNNMKSLYFSIDGLPICASKDLFKYMEEYHNKDVCEEVPQMGEIKTEYKDFIIDRKSNLKYKYDFCKNCKKNTLCEGVWNGYFEKEETKTFIYRQFIENNYLK